MRWPVAMTGNVATRGPGLRGPSAPDRGGAGTRTEPACGLKELVRSRSGSTRSDRQALKRTQDAPEKRCRDCGDRRGGQSLRRAAWPHEDPDSVAPAPRVEVELKRGQNPRAG
ncbi:hypothetical protein NDU88_001878 [Pleurodeles waltl]|uniref:Uncharacterized protein n=1 Tax=Pleurodeles waltl TaxID=8319 RepID=A0AAV7U8F6_PLEWA|nr:hypothetical protein NDU88_001878 [Pleurodeles waltl]